MRAAGGSVKFHRGGEGEERRINSCVVRTATANPHVGGISAECVAGGGLFTRGLSAPPPGLCLYYPLCKTTKFPVQLRLGLYAHTVDNLHRLPQAATREDGV